MSIANGFQYHPKFLSISRQQQLVQEIEKILQEAPLFTPRMPGTGRPFSVRMSNCGSLGWVSDKDKGYRYQAVHPETGKTWPPISASLLQIWEELAEYPAPPEACLINWYQVKAKIGLHQDRDEVDLRAPVLSVSLGDRAKFKIGGLKRTDPTETIVLDSGDVLLLAGESRLAFHGITAIKPSTSDLLSEGGRINLTLRRVNPPI